MAALSRGSVRRLRTASNRARPSFLRSLLVVVGIIGVCGSALEARAEIGLPSGDPRDSIVVRASEAQRWKQGSYEVWLLPSGGTVEQGGTIARARRGVVWIDRVETAGDEPSRVLAYLEDDVVVEFPSVGPAHRSTGKAAQTIRDRTWFGRFHTLNEVSVQVPVVAGEPQTKPEIWQRAVTVLRDGAEWPVRPAQFVGPLGPGPAPPIPLAPGNAAPGLVAPGPANPFPTVWPPVPSAPDAAGPPPAVGRPSAFQPAPFQPGTQPGVQPGFNPPSAPQPGFAQPGFAQPGVPQPGAFQPGIVQPGVPASPQPNALFPGAVAAPQPAAPPAPMPTAAISKIESRNASGFDFRTFPGPDGKTAGFIIDSGVRIVFDSIQNVQLQGYQVQRVEVETDRIVVWGQLPPSLGGGRNEGEVGIERPIEVYMEGNIVFREGDRVIYAERMYYNVTQRFGVVLAAEMLTPIPEYQGLVRLKADAIQMFNEQTFQAHGAAVTSSRLGVPRYWFQSDTVQFTDQKRTRTDPITRLPAVDPQTGEPQVDHDYLATSSNNWIYIGGAPVLYWPTLATDLKDPSYYLERVQVKNDDVFGTQVLLDWDVYQLLGIRNRPEKTRWQLSTDVLTDRGFGLGTNFVYEGDLLLGHPGAYNGRFDAWGIYDSGLDNLGIDRRALEPESLWRGRMIWLHRHRLPWDIRFTGELGLISDRNFHEEYFEREWDQGKDLTTGIELKQLDDNVSWALTADARLNEFFTQTEWLPRFDHYWLGQSLLNDTLTWSEHTHVGYGNLKITNTPKDPADLAKFSLLPWETPNEGLQTATRQEIDLPVEVGPVKFVPYAMGEVAYWGNDVNGDPMTRLSGQAGLRVSMPFWRADPSVQSDLWNLNGLAHKITLEGEMFYADANQDFDDVPLFDTLDDDAIEHFRRRLLFNTFDQTAGTFVPDQFDARYYALRSGLQGWVTSPITALSEDLTMAKVGVRQRWQTKRGLPGRQRIVDWIALDVEAALYPNPDRDNFGETVGLVNYDFRWHLGDRFSLLSDGFADVFPDGLRTASIGALISRPERGSFYVGFRKIDGPSPVGALTPLTADVLTATLSYRMSEKWIAAGSASYDFGPGGNIGQTFNLIRVGESFLVRVGFNYDYSRDNFGAAFSIEPRFLPSSRLGRVAGVPIPPAGSQGLE